MKSKVFCLLSGMFLSIFLLNCSSGDYSEVTITIDLGLGSENAVNMQKSSIFDRIMRFFEKDAAAGTAPSNISSMTLNVTGSGMDAIKQTYTGTLPSKITLDVPAGNSRQFEILAYTPSATLRGAATRDLAGGTVVNITLNMGLYETKIVIPDYYNNRIVQIDNISGSGWIEKNVSYPYDIDFDSSGRIFIAHNNEILRMDDINDTFEILYNEDFSYTSIAIDKNKDIMYYSPTSSLFKNNLNGTDQEELGINTNANTSYQIMDIRGMDVDQNGKLYIAGASNTEADTIFRYNPDNESVETINNNPAYLYNPWDIIVKGDYVYVANYDSDGSNNKITRFNLDLSNPIVLNKKPDASDQFYGPWRFVAILNKKIFIADDGHDSPNIDRIIAFDDINGTNWTTYGSSGDGDYQFNFYNYYFC